MEYYEVAPTKLIRAGSGTFTYAHTTELPIGTFVMVTVGKTSQLGVVIAKTKKPSYETKRIDEISLIPALPVQLVETAAWISEYYHTHLAVVLQTILPRGLTKNRRMRQKKPHQQIRSRTNFVLNTDQAVALEQLEATSPGTAIIHGVTGSGKTAVYIEYAKRRMRAGSSVIILVPEIALTSQLVAEFSHHFPDIILTHSRQTEAERHAAWLEAATSDIPRIVIGPRSALFMPLKSIGAIIIDEAHEPSFKQDQSPRYSALRVAGVLAQKHGALAIQGSATPLVAEYYLAQHNNRPIINLPHRARREAIEPTVTVIDMTKKSSFTRHRLFSDTMISAMQTSLEAGDQVLIFHNRRGSASTTLCESCGWSAICPRCFVPYTLHADVHRLRCHICGHTERVPTSCPECHSTEIIHKGIGTKLIEAEIKKLFPTYLAARFDGDSANENTVENQYRSLYDGTIRIIIGTQVIAKGLDLPHLRTVGVIQADAGLSLPDYGASERTFQLLAQVVGRVGRSAHDTQVIVQSYQPDAPAVRYGIAQDYAQFYKETITIRRRSIFPPFSYLLKLTCVYKTEPTAIRNAISLANEIKRQFPDVLVFGPTPAFYERQHDTYRWQVIIKSPKRTRLLEVADRLPPAHWQSDIDPLSLL